MFKFLKRFSEPVFANKNKSLKMLIESSLGSFWFDLLPLLTIPYLIRLMQTEDKNKILYFCLWLSVFYIFLWIIHFFIRKWDFEAKYGFQIFLEKKYRTSTLLKNSQQIERIGTGKVQSIIQKGMHAWSEANWQIIYQIPKTLIGISAGFYIMFQLGYKYLFVFILIIIIASTLFYFFRKKQFLIQKEENEIDNIKNENSVRVIMSRQEIVFSGKEKIETNKLVGLNQEGREKAIKWSYFDFISDLMISGTGSLLPFIIIIFYLNFNDLNLLKSPQMLSFIYFSTRFAFTMYSTLWIVRQIFEHYPQIEKFWDFVDNVSQIKNYETGKKFVHNGGTIELKNINFSYQDIDETDITENILVNFNLKIKPGTKVAFVGRSGSGKTTIAKLISGYLKVDPKENGNNKGEVIVDGQNLNEVSLKSYYKYIGYLTQEPMVFDGTIRENLLYAVSEKVSDEKITEALIKAECLFVFQSKNGLETQIGEKGIRLSGGERQRLAIAKLFLKNPEIIILDEPTSALDSFSEETISKSLEELFKGRTTIIIAHRLQTVKNADRILVLETGKIVEDGNHKELIALDGKYAKMLEMQSGF